MDSLLRGQAKHTLISKGCPGAAFTGVQAV
jgi:hypothetical protein